MINDDAQQESQSDLTNAIVADQTEAVEPKPVDDDIALSDPTAVTDEELDTLEDSDVDDDHDADTSEPDLTPGMKKRIAKLSAKHERDKAELKAEFDMKFQQIQGSLYGQVQPPINPYAIPMNAGYPSQQQSYDPNQFNAAVPATYEQFKHWEQQREMERRQNAEAQEVQNGIQKVMLSSRTKAHLDPEYQQLLTTHAETCLNPSMLYALKDLKDPANFLKRVLRNEKDRAALLQLQTKNNLEQVATLASWAAKHEALGASRNPAQSAKSRPIPQVKGGASTNARSKPGLDLNNSGTWSKANIKDFMKGR